MQSTAQSNIGQADVSLGEISWAYTRSAVVLLGLFPQVRSIRLAI